MKRLEYHEIDVKFSPLSFEKNILPEQKKLIFNTKFITKCEIIFFIIKLLCFIAIDSNFMRKKICYSAIFSLLLALLFINFKIILILIHLC